MGTVRDDLHQAAYYVAREKGYFGDLRLEVREGGVFDSSPEEMSALSAGELDMGYADLSSAVMFTGTGMADVRIVAQATAGGSAVVARNGLEAPDIASLDGRTVAVPGYSSVQDFLLRDSLEKEGVSEAGVDIIVLKPQQMQPALSASRIDAAVACEPYPSMMQSGEAGRILTGPGRLWEEEPCRVLVVGAAFLRENPDTVRRVVEAHARATRYITDNPLEAADIAARFTGWDAGVARQAFGEIEFSIEPREEAVASYVRFLDEKGVIEVRSAAGFTRALVDTSLLPKQSLQK